MVLKCKMCGGTLKINANQTTAVCEYCGTQQTLPKMDDDRRANLYDRANHYRRNNEFDKAMSIYENILNEDNTDAEAYWSLVLCRYGIEYVEDPATHKRVPTVNRTQFTSIFDDDNYKSALRYADAYQKPIYEQEAKAINEIQKGILAISQKEEPFDVFICYKETDNNGRRTPDSVLANDLYHQLTQEGFKVFFSRITLEDKLGSAYEPYIFAALNSARVMIVLGTKPEYFNAVWVKNEWSRYLALIRGGAKKMLIPAYKDMDPYDLPEEFSHLQAQDMSKLGFMQDLIRGIKKIVPDEAVTAARESEVIASGGNVNTEALLKRVYMFLEDGDWKSANEYSEKVLDVEPENASAYLGKLLAELRVNKQEKLRDCKEPFDYSNNYKKVIRFADDHLKKELTDCIEYINTRNERARLDSAYNRAKETMDAADSENYYNKAAERFEAISGYLDSDKLALECREQAEISRKNKILNDGKQCMQNNSMSGYKRALDKFQSISGWEDADIQAETCKNEIEKIVAKKAHRKKKFRNFMILACIISVLVIIVYTVVIPATKYKNAVAAVEKGDIIGGYEALVALNNYKDSKEKAQNIYENYIGEKLDAIQKGDTIFFGSYEQDNRINNGKEAIEWIVLDVQDGKALLLSKYGLDCKQYHAETDYKLTWETCLLRKWLNNDFMDAAFSAEDKARIPQVTVPADKNPKCDEEIGNPTQDQVFLLSIIEFEKYLRGSAVAACEPSDYAVANGCNSSGKGFCDWWLRTPGALTYDIHSEIYHIDSDFAACVWAANISHSEVTSDDLAVRPAIWINLNQ